MNRLEDALKKLYGLPPYNTSTNICYGDPFFARDIESKFSRKEIEKAKKKLNIKR